MDAVGCETFLSVDWSSYFVARDVPTVHPFQLFENTTVQSWWTFVLFKSVSSLTGAAS